LTASSCFGKCAKTKKKDLALAIGFYWSPLLNLSQINKKKWPPNYDQHFGKSLPIGSELIKSGLNEKRQRKMGILYGHPSLMSFLSLSRLTWFKWKKKERKKDRTKKINGVYLKNEKNKNGVPLRGLNAMPFRSEARKCNHWATGGLLELRSKFNGTYMHMKCRFYWPLPLGLKKCAMKKMKALALVIGFYWSIIKSLPNKRSDLPIKTSPFAVLCLLDAS